ncbi:PadR family transcriptional regulator [Xanthobacter sediminis]|uniref:PadR family transcriptional regulator n=1 Tax=Xanthobacter sediminis TaxID=3119926 RepID=UPI003727F4B6
MEHQELLSGLVRLHILHHAVEGEVYRRWMIAELARHGYHLSPGTLYPMLHTMERRGDLTARTERPVRRLCSATPMGREALDLARRKVRGLFREMLPED